jgi:DNA-binding XRE family transcriptional regulator
MEPLIISAGTNPVIDHSHAVHYTVETERKEGTSISLASIDLSCCQGGVLKEQSGGGRTNGVPVPRLAFLRKQAGLSQQALAERARVSRQTINRLEHGANARYDTIKRLTQALKVSPARLIKSSRQRSFQAPSSSSEP